MRMPRNTTLLRAPVAPKDYFLELQQVREKLIHFAGRTIQEEQPY